MIDNWRMLGDEFDRAVVLNYLLLGARHAAVRVGAGLRNEVESAKLDELAGRLDRAKLEDACKRYQEAILQQWNVKDHERVLYFGNGPKRDVKLAVAASRIRRESGWSDARIRQYLELYGFINPSGTVGRWSHDQFGKLWQ